MTYVGIMKRIKEGFAASGLPPSHRIERDRDRWHEAHWAQQ
jgi:hypothetical protein